jgi:hypothetical protein
LTNLIRTENQYRKVKPEKSKFVSEVKIDKNIPDPILNIKIEQQYLTNKVYTLFYETKRKDKKGIENIVGIALMGAATGFYIGAKNTTANDTSARALMYLGGIASGLGGLYLILKSTPTEDFTEDSIDYKDTTYTFGEPASLLPVSLTNLTNNQTQSVNTDDEGILKIDIRKYYNDLNPGQDLSFSIAYLSVKPTLIKIPSVFIDKIKSNETESDSIFNSAEKSIFQKKFIAGSRLLQHVIQKYPYTVASFSALDKLALIESDIKEENNEVIRSVLKLVSLNRVPEATDKAGITGYELESLGNSIQNLSNSKIKRIMLDGLGFSLNENETINEFNYMNSAQKIYAILTASEKLGGIKSEQINNLLRIGDSISRKLAGIDCSGLLNK